MSPHAEVQIPEKLFYRINEVASLTGVKPYVLRYWETEFPTLTPEKDQNDQRRYRRQDIELVLQIKALLYDEKYTIAGARRKLSTGRGSSRDGSSRASAKAATSEETPDVFDSLQAQDSPAKGGRSKRLEGIRSSLEHLRRDLHDLYQTLN